MHKILLLLSAAGIVAQGERITDLIKNLPSTDCKFLSKTYSGYLRTQSPTRKLHYVLVESEYSPKTDPLLVWFNGGPGCSSMLGLIQEHGPCVIEDYDTKVQRNPYPWNKNASVLYIESPAGVGFSVGQVPEDFKFTDHSQSVDTFVALRDFYESWPEFVTNNLYITGESYAGIYAPFLALQIHEWNQEVINSRGYANSMRKIYPLAGYIIGNGVTDWDFDGPPAYMEALFQNFRVNDTIYKEWNSLGCKYWYRNLKTKVNDPRCSDIQVNVIYTAFQDYSIYDLNRTLNKSNSVFETYKDLPFEQFRAKFEDRLYLRSDPAGTTPFVTEYLNKPEVRKTFNIPDSVQAFEICNDQILEDYRSQLQASVWIYKKMKDQYRILHYSGTTDGAVPTNGTKSWIKNANFQESKAQRSWTTNGTFSGHITEYGNFMFATVHNTGHMAPQWKRPEVQGLITKFIFEQDIN